MLTENLPAFPAITGLMFEPPQKSIPEVLSTSSDRLNLLANSDNSSKLEWVADVPGAPCTISPAILENYWGGTLPVPYTLTLRHYWSLVDSQVVPSGTSYKKSYTESYGVTTTDTETISAELGVEAAGLSAKISASFSHSVEISKQTSVTTEYSVDSPPEGQSTFWILWQLVSEIVALDANGNVIPNIPPSQNGEGDVSWLGNSSPFPYASGAFLSYPTVQQDFPSSLFRQQTKNFPSN